MLLLNFNEKSVHHIKTIIMRCIKRSEKQVQEDFEIVPHFSLRYCVFVFVKLPKFSLPFKTDRSVKEKNKDSGRKRAQDRQTERGRDRDGK